MNARLKIPGARDFYRRAYMSANYRLRNVAGGKWADHCLPTDINILLTNLKPGKHTLHIQSTLTQEVNDGFYKNEPGTYITTLKLNIGPENYAKPCPALKTKPATQEATVSAVGGGSGKAAFLGFYGVPSACGQEVFRREIRKWRAKFS